MSEFVHRHPKGSSRGAGVSGSNLTGFVGRSSVTDTQIRLARAHMESDRQEDAIRMLNEVLRADFRCVEAHLLAAAAHEKLGRLAEAADHLALLLAVEPEHAEANRRLAAILGRLGDTRGFVRCLRKIVAMTNAEDMEALSMLGIGLSEDGQHSEAIEMLQRVADACPQLGSAQADLGMALLNAGQFDNAAAALTRALALDPTSAQAYCGLGLCYRRAGRWREAAEAFMSTEQLAPRRAIGPFNLALVLEALGDGHGARQAMFRAAALDPNDEEIERALERFLPRGPDDAGPRRPITAVTSAFDASIRGDLRMFPLPDVLEFLRLQTKTGTLAVTSRRGVGGVRIVVGRVTSASAPGVKRLGEELVEAGIIARPRLEAILTRQRVVRPVSPSSGGTGGAHDAAATTEALGAVLLRERIIGEGQLTELLSRQIQRALAEMLTWQEGAFSFHPEGDQDPPPVSFNLQEIILDLVRIGDEHMRLDSDVGGGIRSER